jgi:hypothetical protein
MKFLFVAHAWLMDCGKASKQTRGQLSGPFTEAGASPLNRYNNG